MGVFWAKREQRWVAEIRINGKKYQRTAQTQEEAESLLEELRRNPEQVPRKRATNGNGSVSWSKSKQRWFAVIRIDGKQYERYSKTQEEAEALLEELRRDPNATPRNRAPNGSGSVFWNKSKQRWRASIAINGKQRTHYAPTRELAELALIELRRELGLAQTDTIDIEGEHDMATIEDVARRAALAAIEYHKKQTPLAIQQRMQIATLAIELRQAMAAQDWQAVERIAEAMEEAGAEV